MLLEQHKEAVLNLLSDPKLLEEQVNFALKTLKEYVTSKCLQNITTFADKFIYSLSQGLALHISNALIIHILGHLQL